MCLRYLHISDLHLTGLPQKKKGSAVERFNQDMVTGSMLNAIENLGKPFDLIFITGDLAKSGKSEQYEVVKVFCKGLLKATGLPPERLFVVPGNHDVDRAEIQPYHVRRWYAFEKADEVTEVLEARDMFPVLMRKLAAFNAFAEDAMGRRVFTETGFYFAEATSIPKDRATVLVNVVGLNSTLFAGYDGDDKQKLAFGLPQVSGALDRLDKQALLTIAMFHHPFTCFHPADHVCRNRLIQNADIILTGHLHEPGNMFVRGAAGQAVLIGAGASFETRESENSFNVVEIDLATGAGRVEFYKYLADYHEWKQNTDANPSDKQGIFHFEIERIRPPAQATNGGRKDAVKTPSGVRHAVGGRYITYYQDIVRGEAKMMKAVMDLEQSGRDFTGITTNRDEKRVWRIKGQIDELGDLRGTYEQATPTDTGRGNFYMEPDSADPGSYNGSWQGHDSMNRKVADGQYRWVPCKDVDVIPLSQIEEELIPQAMAILGEALGERYIDRESFNRYWRGSDDHFGLLALHEKEVVGVRLAHRLSGPEVQQYEAILSRHKVFLNLRLHRVGQLKSIAVKPGFRRHGVGTLLSRKALEELTTKGRCTAVIALVWESGSRESAGSLLEELGLKRKLRIEEFWKEDSIRKGYGCPQCGNPCRCAASFFFEAF